MAAERSYPREKPSRFSVQYDPPAAIGLNGTGRRLRGLGRRLSRPRNSSEPRERIRAPWKRRNEVGLLIALVPRQRRAVISCPPLLSFLDVPCIYERRVRVA
jgi:hypothetical protein